MNIMVVDDEKVQIESLRRGLKSRRFDVVEALNGDEAMKCLNDENGSIDMVITDYAMPGMNGMDLLRKIREKNDSLPVIMMTAYGEKDLVIDAMRNSCNSFIEKPFTLEMLNCGSANWLNCRHVHLLKSWTTSEPRPRHGA